MIFPPSFTGYNMTKRKWHWKFKVTKAHSRSSSALPGHVGDPDLYEVKKTQFPLWRNTEPPSTSVLYVSRSLRLSPASWAHGRGNPSWSQRAASCASFQQDVKELKNALIRSCCPGGCFWWWNTPLRRCFRPKPYLPASPAISPIPSPSATQVFQVELLINEVTVYIGSVGLTK